MSQHFRISAKTEGFRRAGRAWSAAGEVVARADFTDEEWAALEAESEIVIVPADPPEGAGDPEPESGDGAGDPEPAPKPAGRASASARKR